MQIVNILKIRAGAVTLGSGSWKTYRHRIPGGSLRFSPYAAQPDPLIPFVTQHWIQGRGAFLFLYPHQSSEPEE